MADNVVVRNIPRTHPAVLDALAAGGTATVHEAQGRTGLLAREIRPVQSGASVAGSAVTVLTHPGDNLMIHAAIEVCGPGDVLVVATKTPNTDGMIGDLVVTSLRARGVAGIVTDAGVRDVAVIREMGFPIWTRAISAQGTVKASPGSVNVPVVCGGQLVNPGDAMVCDDDGVVCVPRERGEEVVAGVQARTANEDEKRARFEAGELGLDMYGLRAKLTELGVEYREGES
jgi:4-hydroxy-4-methyl-2-oxoglutarate aldolase